MKKLITKGKVSLNEGTNFSEQYVNYITSSNGRHPVCGIEIPYDGIDNNKAIETAKANASLIAEAFNITNECGFTPAELLAQRNELLDALKEMYKSCNPISVIRNKTYTHGGITEYYVGGCGIPSNLAIHKAQQAINNAK